MDPGEQAHLAHQRYMLETGQWAVSGQELASPGSLQPMSENPIGERLAAASAQQVAASSFDPERWGREHLVRYDVRLHRVIRVEDSYEKVVRDFLLYAPTSRLSRVWVYDDGHGGRLLMDQSPDAVVDQMSYLNRTGMMNRRAAKRDARDAVRRLQDEASEQGVYRILYSSRTDPDTGKRTENPFFIFPDGKTGAGFTALPSYMADRCVEWLHRG